MGFEYIFSQIGPKKKEKLQNQTKFVSEIHGKRSEYLKTNSPDDFFRKYVSESMANQSPNKESHKESYGIFDSFRKSLNEAREMIARTVENVKNNK